MFRYKIIIYCLIIFFSIFSLPGGIPQQNSIPTQCMFTTAAVYGSFAPPVQPSNSSNVNKKIQKKAAKKAQQKRQPRFPSVGLYIVLALYLFGIIYFGALGLALILLGILSFFVANISMSIWIALILIILGIGVISFVFDLWPIFKKFRRLKGLFFEPNSLDHLLLNKTLWLGVGYFLLVLVTAFLPIALTLISNFWILLIIIAALGSLYRRVQRALNKNLDDLLKKVPQENQRYNGNNLNNGNFNRDLLDDGY